MLPTPGGLTSATRPDPSPAHTESRSVASMEWTASTRRSPSGPSTSAMSERTASSAWGATSRQAAGSQVAGAAVPPGRRAPGRGVRRVGDGEPPARGVPVAHQPEPAVAGHPGGGLRVDADLQVAQGAVTGQVGEADVVAGGGADGGGDDQPPAVGAGAHPEIGGRVAALA